MLLFFSVLLVGCIGSILLKYFIYSIGYKSLTRGLIYFDTNDFKFDGAVTLVIFVVFFGVLIF